MGQMITPATHENPINSPLTTKQLNTFIPAILISLQFVSSILFAKNCKKMTGLYGLDIKSLTC